jgi:hypothetical protein
MNPSLSISIIIVNFLSSTTSLFFSTFCFKKAVKPSHGIAQFPVPFSKLPSIDCAKRDNKAGISTLFYFKKNAMRLTIVLNGLCVLLAFPILPMNSMNGILPSLSFSKNRTKRSKSAFETEIIIEFKTLSS